MGGWTGRAPHPPENEDENREIQVTLTDAQAWEFAQLLKRIGFSEYRQNATSDEAAYHMRDAGELIRCALAQAGYTPR
jgi:hypothetical protein